MKLTIISDIHLGVKNNDELFLSDVKRFFSEELSGVIEKENSDYLIIAGDLFDNMQNINILVKYTAIDIINSLLKKFTTLKIIILKGNHDVYYKNTLEVSSTEMFVKFDPRVEVVSQIKKFNFDGCKAVLVPWLIEAGKNKIIFDKIVEKYKETNEKQFDLCIGHFNTIGFEVVRGVVAKHGYEITDFKAFETVFSGHYHIRNKIDNFQYLGCPYEITWNDWGNEKGITTFDTNTRKAEFYPNKTSPKHIMVKLSSLESGLIKEDDIKNQFVKFIIDKNIQPDKKMEFLNIVEKNAKDYSIIDESVSLDDGESVVVDESKIASPLDFLQKYTDDIEIPKNIDKDKLKLKLTRLYDVSIKGQE